MKWRTAMNNFLILALALVAGILLGAIFFGGLWWTVRKGVAAKNSALWFLGSMLLRMGIVLAGFYFVGRGDWRRLVSCLLGFIVARFIVMRLTRTPIENGNSKTKEASHAP
jgi:F1F0 ATPase subunit 2